MYFIFKDQEKRDNANRRKHWREMAKEGDEDDDDPGNDDDGKKGKKKRRTGPGEYGKAVILEGDDRRIADDVMVREGVNLVTSNAIRIDRAVPDYRFPE